MKSLLFLFLSLPLFVSCIFLKPDFLQEINSQELAYRLSQQDLFLVDVHIPEQRHIAGTDLFVPYDQVVENLKLFPSDKNTPIYIYCESGPMGNAAARSLHQAGYKTLFNLKGGADAWKEAGFEFE